jgi:DNA modification methylase
VTSPPYWGLRDYGVTGQLGSEPSPDCGTHGQAQCGRCFVCSMVAVFRGVRRVLRDDGTCWLNLGDSYTGGTTGRRDAGAVINGNGITTKHPDHGPTGRDTGLAGGNLVGVPWRVALALQTDGWVLRQDVIWHKPAPMPESVRNRCTKAHEYVFLLTKGARYFYDAEAIKERSAYPGDDRSQRPDDCRGTECNSSGGGGANAENRNKRSVWTVSSQGYEGAHFATFPPKLIEPMILAGTSAKGACGRCGAPWRRVTEEQALRRDRPNEYVKRTGEDGTGNSCGNGVAGVDVKTVGWEPTCGCGTGEVVPCTVLDPHVGSGTTCAVAVQAGRRGWGIDLSEKYLRENAVVRVKGALLARPNLTHLVPRVAAAPRTGVTGGTNLLRPGPRGGGG